jgi:adenine-specific DNA methylase
LTLLGPGLEPEQPAETPLSFRPIHYLGSKLRLIGPIAAAVNDVASGRGPVVDLFAGSGTVSLALSREREVISVDIQEYSRVVCSAILRTLASEEAAKSCLVETARVSEHYRSLRHAVGPLVRYEAKCVGAAEAGDLEPLCEFVEKGSVFAFSRGRLESISAGLRRALADAAGRLAASRLEGQASSLVTRYFGGAYFSFAQAAELDGLLEVIHEKSGHEREYFLAVALSAASDVVNTVGKQFAQPIRPRDSEGRPKAHLFRQIVRDRLRSVFETYAEWLQRYGELPRPTRRHKVARLDYREFLRKCSRDVSVVYADPPYTRDHYSRYYHVLETMCLRDNPEVSTMRVDGRELLSRGFYREDRHQSPFCIKSQAPGAFTELFEGVSRLGAPLVVSYSPYQADERARPRLMTVEAIVELARKHFAKVDVRSVGRYAHNKFNQQERNTRVFYDSEVLILCRD